ncbi:DUF305 domain-containing protein [Rhizohabitans arisaemae]|uniref:DUF305 domain-containing protein n=1 Tax=Rhizohabitans arisaemae TaxID=2720610 RepID=UPI0024B156B4|nr:DUF305 domain-containing protein [Rhizohabitans arisaemae]
MRAAVLAGISLFLLVGCTGSPAENVAAPPVHTAPVLAPGKPGEPAATLKPSEYPTAVPSEKVNAADVQYVENMILHHRQALDMSDLAPTRAANQQVKAIASRIKDSQEPEIKAMAAWLTNQDLQVPEHHSGTHPNMPGMATPDQLTALRAATGPAFDKAYLELMIVHHQGAVTMAEQLLLNGSHVMVEEMAKDVVSVQTGEINRLRAIQARL